MLNKEASNEIVIFKKCNISTGIHFEIALQAQHQLSQYLLFRYIIQVTNGGGLSRGVGATDVVLDTVKLELQ